MMVCLISVGTSGCCTIAHSGEIETWDDNTGGGEACPWLIGDALLLIPGIVPGVIAFVVDFATGEWRHAEAYPLEEPVPAVAWTRGLSAEPGERKARMG
jgi:hypothetical protein